MDSALVAARNAEVAALPSRNWEARTAAFAGRITAAHELYQTGIQQAANAGLNETAAQWQVEDAEAHALTGNCADVTTEISGALARSRDNFTLERAARTLAFCGQAAPASALTAELARRFPDATLTRQIQVPVVEALTALRRQPTRALDRLEAVRPYDNAPSAEFWPAYIRGMAFLSMKDGGKAAGEFQQLVAHRSAGPTSLLYPLATLGMGRAAALSGEADRARGAYDEFFRLWRDADPQLPEVQQARREYAALR
jgi:hypothetical protein